MKSVVVYESMYGNTHLIADAVADGLRPHGDVAVVAVDRADAALLGTADLVVVGGPTHAHGMSRADTRTGAVIASSDEPGSRDGLDADAEGRGLRDWFASLGQVETNAAAFDTRVDRPAAFTGRASKGIARKLRHHGATLVAEPRSFLVTTANRLEPDEQARARGWGDRLGFDVDGTGYFFPRASPTPPPPPPV
ncbi:MAG: flavodoxin family protein [Acidimicrobiia bacterium]